VVAAAGSKDRRAASFIVGAVDRAGRWFPVDQQLIAAVPKYQPSAPRKPPVGVPEQEG
jgi:hypothetical protein